MQFTNLKDEDSSYHAYQLVNSKQRCKKITKCDKYNMCEKIGCSNRVSFVVLN